VRSNPPLLILNLGGFGAIELPAVESPEWGSLGVGVGEWGSGREEERFLALLIWSMICLRNLVGAIHELPLL